VGEKQYLFVSADDAERRSGVSKGVLSFLGDEQLVELVAADGTAEPVPVFEVHRLALTGAELEAVTVVMYVESVVAVEPFQRAR